MEYKIVELLNSFQSIEYVLSKVRHPCLKGCMKNHSKVKKKALKINTLFEKVDVRFFRQTIFFFTFFLTYFSLLCLFAVRTTKISQEKRFGGDKLTLVGWWKKYKLYWKFCSCVRNFKSVPSSVQNLNLIDAFLP